MFLGGTACGASSPRTNENLSVVNHLSGVLVVTVGQHRRHETLWCRQTKIRVCRSSGTRLLQLKLAQLVSKGCYKRRGAAILRFILSNHGRLYNLMGPAKQQHRDRIVVALIAFVSLPSSTKPIIHIECCTSFCGRLVQPAWQSHKDSECCDDTMLMPPNWLHSIVASAAVTPKVKQSIHLHRGRRHVAQ